MEFRERIKKVREEKGMNLTQLAASFDLKEAGVRSWENGRTKPGADTLIKLSEYFDCTTDYLLGLSEYRNESERLTTEKITGELQKALDRLLPDEQKELAEIINSILASYKEAKELDSYPAYKEELHKKYVECMTLIAQNTNSSIREFKVIYEDEKISGETQQLLAMRKGQGCIDAITSLYKAIDKEIDNVAKAKDQGHTESTL